MPSKIKSWVNPISKRYEESPDRKNDRAFYSSPSWRMARLKALAANPICACGCGRLAQMVHHDVPRKDAPERALDPTNLKPMTHQCHTRLENERKQSNGIS